MFSTPIAKLLIVDDEVPQMKALCETLEGEGYTVVGVTSASAALSLLQQQSFDLILTDLMMPEIDGIALLRTAREIDPNVVGIVMTGHGAVSTAVESMREGAVDYILKPFRLTSIRGVLARALAVRQLRIENAQLHEALDIYEQSMAVAFALDVDAILEKVADAALLHNQVSGVSILVPSQDGQELRVAVARGEKAGEIRGARIPFSAALSTWLEQRREPPGRAEEIAEGTLPEPAPLGPVPSNFSLPMLAGGKLTGILNLTSEHKTKLARLGQSRAMNVLAGAAASAIERASLFERLRLAEQRYRLLTENAPDVVYRFELEPRPGFTYLNPAVQAITGFSPAEFYADPELPFRIAHPEDLGVVERILAGENPDGKSVMVRVAHKNGHIVWMEQRGVRMRDADGRIVAVEGISRDITERRLAEEKIRRSLQEKDVMLNEIHHRVKNNLQVVCSLLSLQANQIQDSAARQAFTESQNRIQSMALIHQQLYMSSNFAEIDFATYLRSLANQVLASYASMAGSFSVSLDTPGSALSLDEAIPCGLIVNELLSNCIKHSFHGRASGTISVGFHTAGSACTLTVDDDGAPLPDLFANLPPAMGARLITALTTQLGGEFFAGKEPKYRVTFATKAGRAQVAAAAG